ncbi:MAG: hypothetical protein M1404_02690 [Acidobacteria bacterium]|nr:hypothetical protein [Acidobacteriota bacterium]
MSNQSERSSQVKQIIQNSGSAPPDERSDSPPGEPRGTRAILQRVFSFPVFLGMLLVAGFFAGRLLNPGQLSSSGAGSISWLEGDTWWHLAVGNQILKTHIWPTHDPYSFTAPASPWIAYEWLGEVLIAFAWRLGSLRGLMILLGALAGAILLLLYYQAYLRCKNSKAAFVACTLLLPLVSLTITMRPQLLGYIFLIATLIVLEKFRQGHQRALWVLPPIFLLWVNAHGTFVFGFLILGVYWASGLKAFEFGGLYAERWTERDRQRLEFISLLCLLASTLTPYGTRLLAYPLEMASSQPLIVQSIQEWEPLNLSLAYGKYFVVLLLVFWLALVASRLRCRLQDFVLLAFAIGETFLHARFILLFVPVFAPLLAELLAKWIPQYQPAKDHYILNFVLMALIAAGIVKLFPSNRRLEQKVESKMPVRAVWFFRAHPALKRTLNDAYWGGYLIEKLWPTHKVFIDGRLDLYEYSGVMADYLNMTRLAPDTRFLLRKYQVQSCLLPRSSPLAVFLAASPNWQEVYQDNLSAVFVRKAENESGNATERNEEKAKGGQSG